MDIIFTIVLVGVFAFTMKKHNTWKPVSGVADLFGLILVALFALALVRFPIYIIVYGLHIPFPATSMVQFISGVIAIMFWFCMLYWRIPMRLLGRNP